MKLFDVLQSNPTLLLVSVIISVCFCVIIIMIFMYCKLEHDKRISKSALELNRITNSIHAGLVHFIPKDTYNIYYASKGFYDLLGYTKNEAREENKTSITDFIFYKDLDTFREVIKDEKREGINSEVRLVKKDGNIIYCLMNGNYAITKDGEQSVSAVFVDITEQKRMQEMLRLDRERYRIASELSNDVLFEYHIDTDKMQYTEKYTELFGRNPNVSDYIANSFDKRDLIHPDDYGLFIEYCSKLSAGKEFISAEFRLKDRNNDYIWCQFMGKTIYDKDNKPLYVIGKMINVDYQKREIDSLEYKATRDPLTGVYNREVTIKKIEKFINGNKNGRHVLMFIDFDDFKQVNDNYGHLVGDRVLTYVIARIKSVFSEGEIIGRIGGDEFVVFSGHIDSYEAIIGKAQTLVEALNTTYTDDASNCTIKISGSVGIAAYPENGIHYEQLIQCADKALYNVKNSGKNNYMLFSYIS